MQKHEVSHFTRPFALASFLRYNSPMGKARGVYKPRTIDRAVFAILAAVMTLSGLYVLGPWYLEVDEGNTAPLYHLFDDVTAVRIFGVLILITGLFLFWCSWAKGNAALYTTILTYTLLCGFILRLYSMIGVALALDSWRPPGYLSMFATVFILGAYWVWVKVNVRLAE